MKKKTATIVTAVAAVLAVAMLVFVLTDPFHLLEEPEPSLENTNYVKLSTAYADTGLPLMQSEIDTVFYTMSTEGAVTFYEYADGALAPVEPTGTVEVAPLCSNQPIPATVTYLKRGAQVTGYGLFTTEITPVEDSKYDYFFLNLRNVPPGFPDEDGTQFLLLLDGDKDALYEPFKTYEESFYLEPDKEDVAERTNPRTNRFIDQTNRRINPATARNEEDFCVLTDDMLAGAADGRSLFFSGRHSAVTDPVKRKDIYIRNKGNDVRTPSFTDISFDYAYESDAGVCYFRKTELGFTLYRGDDVLREFPGTYELDYLRSGNYLLFPSGNAVYYLPTGEEIPLDGVSLSGVSFFSASPDGSKFLIGSMAGDDASRQTLTFYDSLRQASRQAEGAYLFSKADPNVAWIDSDTYFHNCASADQNSKYAGHVFEWNKILPVSYAAPA